MLRTLLVLLCVAIAANALAQAKTTPAKTTKKPFVPEIEYQQRGAPMPDLKLLSYHYPISKEEKNVANINRSRQERRLMKKRNKIASQQYITAEDLDNSANLFVMIFNPNCGHCEDETEMLVKNISFFKRSKLVMMASPVQWPNLHDFVKSFHVADYSPIFIGIDSANFIGKVFLYQSLPQINIYSADRKLVKAFTGDVPMDTLVRYIQ